MKTSILLSPGLLFLCTFVTDARAQQLPENDLPVPIDAADEEFILNQEVIPFESTGFASATRCSNCYGNCSVGCQCADGKTSCTCCNQPWYSLWHKHKAYFRWDIRTPCPGYSKNYYARAHIDAGRRAQMVFHGFHFELLPNGSLRLTSSGKAKVYDIKLFWNDTPGQIWITPSGNDELNSYRLQLIQTAFANHGIELSPQDVVIDTPMEPSTTGDRAISIYNQRQLGSPLNPVGAVSTSGGRGAGGSANSPGPPQ